MFTEMKDGLAVNGVGEGRRGYHESLKGASCDAVFKDLDRGGA